MRLAGAAFFYFAIVFGAGFVFGPIRVLLLEPRIGPLGAVVLEAPFLLAAMVFAARLIPRVMRLDFRPITLLACGVLALAMQQVADVAVGVALRGMDFGTQASRYMTAEGAIYLALLILFAAMPWLVYIVFSRPKQAEIARIKDRAG